MPFVLLWCNVLLCFYASSFLAEDQREKKEYFIISSSHSVRIRWSLCRPSCVRVTLNAHICLGVYVVWLKGVLEARLGLARWGCVCVCFALKSQSSSWRGLKNRIQHCFLHTSCLTYTSATSQLLPKVKPPLKACFFGYTRHKLKMFKEVSCGKNDDRNVPFGGNVGTQECWRAELTAQANN